MSCEAIDTERNCDGSESRPYESSYEHLADELKRLDMLIQLRLCNRTSQNRSTDSSLEMFKGLVVMEEEVIALLSGVESPQSADAAEMAVQTERLGSLESHIHQRLAASAEKNIHLPLTRLTRLFHLSAFEEQCLLICLAPELDRKYEKLYAYLQDDVTRKKPSVDLAMSLARRSGQERIALRSSFHPKSLLIKYRLLSLIDSQPNSPSPLISCYLKLDDRIVNYLLGYRLIDARLNGIAHLVSPARFKERLTFESEAQKLRHFVRTYFSKPRDQRLIIRFHGPYGSGASEMAESICRDQGLGLVIVDAERLLDAQTSFDELVWILGREAMLQSAALCIENFDLLLVDNEQRRMQLKSLLEMVQTSSTLTFLLGSRSWTPQGLLGKHLFIEQEFEVPGVAASRLLWENASREYGLLPDDSDCGTLASKFRFTPLQIKDALVTAHNLACRRAPDNPQITSTDILAACRAQSNTRLTSLAAKLEPKYFWPDIVLPSDQIDQLKEICAQAKYRYIVYGEWGFDRKLSIGKGLNVLFSGPPGTGKTMASEVIANELGLDLYKIDLSQVVSKYIGETEKNLRHIFAEARTSYAILFFDEADALFGKRSEVKDAHDRYANIEIGYLLQEMEAYDGIAILATNLRQNMDEAFVRRLQVIVEFPFPDEEHRHLIWKVIFPNEAPINDDVDFSLLAREANLAGGSIKNIALTAAFYAASSGEDIHMHHLVAATRREYQKLGRTWNEAAWQRQTVASSAAQRN